MRGVSSLTRKPAQHEVRSRQNSLPSGSIGPISIAPLSSRNVKLVGVHGYRCPPFPDDVVADVELAVRELATNGVRHSSGDHVTVAVSRDPAA